MKNIINVKISTQKNLKTKQTGISVEIDLGQILRLQHSSVSF